MYLEVRDLKFNLITREKIKNHRKYGKAIKKAIKLVDKYNNKVAEELELMIRVREHSFLVKSGNYGFIIGVKEENYAPKYTKEEI